MNWPILITRLMIVLLAVQLFSTGMGSLNPASVCVRHSHGTNLLKMAWDKATGQSTTDDFAADTNPLEEKTPETCDFTDLVLFHLHHSISLPSLFHIERKNDNHHFVADLKSHVLEVVSPPPEC